MALLPPPPQATPLISMGLGEALVDSTDLLGGKLVSRWGLLLGVICYM